MRARAEREPVGEIPRKPRDLVLTPGTTLGPYEIVALLGAGRMSEV